MSVAVAHPKASADGRGLVPFVATSSCEVVARGINKLLNLKPGGSGDPLVSTGAKLLLLVVVLAGALANGSVMLQSL